MTLIDRLFHPFGRGKTLGTESLDLDDGERLNGPDELKRFLFMYFPTNREYSLLDITTGAVVAGTLFMGAYYVCKNL